MGVDRVEDLEVFRISDELGEMVWNIVIAWDWFAKDTVGKQFVKACDSISADIAEGHGRFHFNGNRQFCYYARGSFEETKTWIRKAHRRSLKAFLA